MKFSQKMRLYFFYTMVQKSQKWPKTQIKGGGPALTAFPWQMTMTLCFLHEKVHQKIKTGPENSGARGPGK